MKIKDRRHIISTLIALAKKSKLNTEQKEKVFDVVKNLKNATEIQKERFIKYYGFDGTECKKLVDMSKICGVTSSTIRGSVIAMELNLAKSNEAFEVIESVVNEFEEKV